MGDVIQLLDSITIEMHLRDDGKRKHHEICIIYPEYMNHDNDVIEYKNEEIRNNIFTRVISHAMGDCFDNS